MAATAKRATRERMSRTSYGGRESVGTQSASVGGYSRRRPDLDEARATSSYSLGAKSETLGVLSSSAKNRHDLSQAAQDPSSTLRHNRRSLHTENSDTSSLKDVNHQASLASASDGTNRTPLRRPKRQSGNNDRADVLGEDLSTSMSLKDHKDHFIKVVVRVRPRIPKELKDLEGCTPQLDEKSIVISDGRAEKIYAVDEVHDARTEMSSQQLFYSQVAKPFTSHSLQGFNVCIFAYGHTGTGKTFTMLGDGASHRHADDSKCGILPRYIREIFTQHEQDPATMSFSFRYTCEYYEVYNEKIRDLLAPAENTRDGKAPQKKTIHVHPILGVKVDGVEPNQVHSASEALELVDFGNKMRTVASTTMNERSSRSHAIFTFKFQLQDADKKTPIRGQEGPGPMPGSESTMTFVDLAGREDQEASTNQAMQFREMCYINSSLFHLAHLITKLSENKRQDDRGLADFRNSKLTLLLSQALIGNCRTLLIATIAPLQMFFEDSVSTLSFAQSVKKIRTKPVQNKRAQSSIVAELEAEVRSLRQELKNQKSTSSDREQELLAAQTWVSHYKRSLEETKQQNDEAKKSRARFSTLHGFHEMMPSSERTEENHVVPFFTKLCDDPALQGCCNYFLHTRNLKVGSDDNGCNIVLKGIGIHSFMCEVTYDFAAGAVEVQAIPQRPAPTTPASRGGGSPVSMRPRSPTEHYTADGDRIPRILINGQPLTSERPSARMKHSDCIILGHSHAFRLIIPTPLQIQTGACLDASVLARSTVESLDMATALAETMDDASSQFKEVCAYVQQLSMRSQESIVQTFLTDMHRICPLIDEANLITKDIFGNQATSSGEMGSRISFQLHVLTDCFNYEDDVPELVICVMQNISPIDKFRAAVRAVIHWLARCQKPTDARPRARRMSDASQESDESSQLSSQQLSLPLSGHEDDWAKGGIRLRRRDTSLAIGKFRHPLVHQMGLTAHMRVGKDTLLYVWALEKFLRRLKEMREIYQEGSDMQDDFSSIRDRLRKRPYLNPWREMNYSDVKNVAEDYRCETSPRQKHTSYSSEGASRSVSEVFSPIPESVATRTTMSRDFATMDSISDICVPKNKTQPYGAMILRFPDAPWPAPEGFTEALQTCLGGLGVSVKLDQLTVQIQEDTYASAASLTQKADAGVMVEVFGPDSEMEEFRKVPIFSRLVVLGFGVDGVQFKTTEAALRLEDRRWNAALQSPTAAASKPPMLGTLDEVALDEQPLPAVSTYEVGLDEKPTSLAEAVRASAGRRGGHYIPAPDAALVTPFAELGETQAVPVSMPAEEISMVSQIRDLVEELKAVAIGSHIPGMSSLVSADSELQDFAQKHIDELRAELATCREETGRMFNEQSRLSSLLGRFESVLTRLTTDPKAVLKTEGGSMGGSTTPSPVRALSSEVKALPQSPRGGIYRHNSNSGPQVVPQVISQAVSQAVSPHSMTSRRSFPSLQTVPRIALPGPSRYRGDRSRTPSPSPPPIVSPRSTLITMPIPALGGTVPYLPRTVPAMPGSIQSALEPGLSRTAWEMVAQHQNGISSPLPPSRSIIASTTQPPTSVTLTSGVAIRSAANSTGSAVASAPILTTPRTSRSTEVLSTAGASLSLPMPHAASTPRRPSPRPTELIANVAASTSEATPMLPSSSKARRESLFSKIDTNKDGLITREELVSAVQSGVISETGASAPSSQPAATPPMQVGQRSQVRVPSQRMNASTSNLPIAGDRFLPAPQAEGGGSLPLASVGKLPLASVIRP